ncbi:MAG: xanthine dehydrogenase family protein molybdopterin-binding subunit [Anaerolineae bacterium]|nr:xanthine dehydrogenase family protein molybdopterin-binding subunit [Anaerolineae bacterium]MDW8068000.1 xanthine dehydrogenase family protein molybdopterin-binding subunit [Anaerolineae bacterium]
MPEQVIGQSIPRVDARAKVTGEAMYPGDFSMPGMLYAKILFAGRPHARILSIETSDAEKVPGVVAIFTAKDVPVNEYGLQTPDQPVLCGPGSAKPGADVVRWVGDQVALVVAETEEAAARARDLIRVEYQDLPIITDPFEAMRPDAYPIHPPRAPNPVHPELQTEGNWISHHQIRKGDVEAAWAACDVVVEAEYRLPSQEHAYLQPEAGLAYIDEEGRITVIVAGQWAWEDQHQIAHALNLPPEQIRVVYPAIGGAFGGREDMSIQIVLALAAWKLRRPVKIVWTREESIIGHGKRHPVWARCRWGATREGKLVAAEVRVVADGGAYCYTTNKVMGNLTVTCTGPYEIPNIRVDVDAYYTNNPPSAAMRGFGAPQGLFLAETQMNKLAEVLGMDPVELRVRNLLREGSLTAMGTPLPGGVHLVEVTERCAVAAGWVKTASGWRKPELPQPSGPVRRGIGFAVGFKNIGFSFGYQENCWAKVELRGEVEIEEAVVYIGSAEVGQGAHTVIVQMAAEALGIPVDRVRLVSSDTATSPGSSGSSSASRTTFMAGNAIRGAAAVALEKWRAEERPAVAEYTYLAPKTTPFDPETGYGTPNFAYGYVAEAVEVEVDTETGQIRIPRVACANDVGMAINPQQVEGQIEGGVVMGLGWATVENFIVREGRVLTDRLSTYLIPTALDVPERVESVIVERPDPRGPWGARGMGEMPVLPAAPALIAAVHDAIGIWFHEFPLTPERVWKSIHRP